MYEAYSSLTAASHLDWDSRRRRQVGAREGVRELPKLKEAPIDDKLILKGGY